VYLIPPSAIQRGAQQIHNVSKRLDTLTDRHPLVSEALTTILGNVRHTATFISPLEGLVLIRSPSEKLSALLCTPIICTANIDWRAPSGFICPSI
jgi:hypothetical protein